MLQRSRAALPVLFVVLTGCTAAPGPERMVEISRVVQAAPADLVPRITDFLQSRQIDVARADPDAGLVRALQQPLQDPAWAECGTVYARDAEGERRRRAELLEGQLELEVALDRLNGQQTRVSVRPEFIGTFHNSFKNLDFERRCGSTGELERALLRAL